MKVLISSTYQDLIPYRTKAVEAVERLGQQGIQMEVFGARPEDATTVCFQEIQESDLVVGIYAHRYGYVPGRRGKSITEMEYDYAIKHRKPVFCFVVDEEYPWRPSFIEGGTARKKLRAFKKRIDAKLVRQTFATPEDLAFKVATSVGRYLSTLVVKEKLSHKAENLLVGTARERDQVANRAARLAPLLLGSRILVVNDRPTSMSYVNEVLVALGMSVSVASSTKEALEFLETQPVDVVISDVCRGVVQDEGFRFLKKMRKEGLHRPTIFLLMDYKPELGTPAYAFGITNQVDEMLNLLFDALERVRDVGNAAIR